MNEIIEKYIKKMKISYKVLAYIFFGIFWSFSNVGYSVALLTWFALAPFLFLLKYEKMKYGIFYAWIFGTSAYLFHLWWMINPFISYFGILPGFLLGLLVLVIFCVYLGFSYALIFIIAKYFSRFRIYYFYLFMPVIFTVIDYFYPKFWADQIGYSQYIFFHFSQIAEIFGVPLITLIIIINNCAVIYLIEAIWYKKNLIKSTIPFALVILTVIILSIFGIFRYNHLLTEMEKAPKARVAIIQGNISGFEKMITSVEDMIIQYNNMTEKILHLKPDLIVWPESAIKANFPVEKVKYDFVKRYNEPIPLLFGAHTVVFNQQKFKFYNSLILVGEDDNKIDEYRKNKLLPFVETIPLDQVILPILKLFNIGGEFDQGSENKIFTLDQIRFSPNICYETIFPDLIRKSLAKDQQKANLMVNATNDSWFGISIEPGMHLHISGFRAIENRRSLVRSTCTGFSAVFDVTGDLMPVIKSDGQRVSHYKSELFQEDAFVVEVPLLEKDTIYNRWGWRFVYLLALILILYFLFFTYIYLRFLKIKADLKKQQRNQKIRKKIWMN